MTDKEKFLAGVRDPDALVAEGWVLFYLAYRLNEEAEKKIMNTVTTTCV